MYAGAQRIADVDAGGTEYYVSDHLGSPRVLLAESGSVETTMDYWPYGSMQLQTSTGDTRFKFTGHERDGESNLDYMLARMYDPGMGRFMQRDPLADKYPHLSPYVYVGNNPLIYWDPDGRTQWPIRKKFTNANGKTFLRKKIDSKFDEKRTRNGVTKIHKGLDMNLGWLSKDLGAPIRATHDGVVSINRDESDKDGAGNRIHIKAEDGSLKTVYMHLKESSTLEVGTEVKEGDVIGYIGGTNGTDEGGPVHLHYELHTLDESGTFVSINPINKNGTLKDPQQMLGLPSNETLPKDLRDKTTNSKPN